MSVMEKISKLPKNGCDHVLLNYICDNYDEIECELNGDEIPLTIPIQECILRETKW